MTSGGGTEAQVGVMYPAERAPGGAAEFSHCFFHSGGVGRRGGIGSCEVGFEDRDGGTEVKMKVRRVHAAGMHDDVGGSDTGGELEGAFRMQEPESAFLIFPRGRLEKIGGGVTDRGRERTEIVDRGNFNPALLDGTENPRCQFEADAVAEFGTEKTEFADLGEHFVAIGVSMRAPAGRERKTVRDFRHFGEERGNKFDHGEGCASDAAGGAGEYFREAGRGIFVPELGFPVDCATIDAASGGGRDRAI